MGLGDGLAFLMLLILRLDAVGEAPGELLYACGHDKGHTFFASRI